MTGVRPPYPCIACDKKGCAWVKEQPCSDCRREHRAAMTPYEQAVRRVEAKSGKSRRTWESALRHPLTLEANRIAREIAGIPEERSNSRSMNKTPCKSRRVA